MPEHSMEVLRTVLGVKLPSDLPVDSHSRAVLRLCWPMREG
jgi:hypothetical protein